METQTWLSCHNKFISAEHIIAILSVSSDNSLHAFLLLQSSESDEMESIAIIFFAEINLLF